MSLKIYKKWHFKPNVRLSILACILLSILVYLGVWQLHRSAYKQNIFLQQQQKINNIATALKNISNPTLAEDRFSPVSIDGVFLNKYTFLLDNQIFDHKVGYRILTPMQAPDLNKWVLIDRGWVAMGLNRNELPKIEIIFGLQHISGIINHISSGKVLKADIIQPTPNWPLLIQSIDYDFISRQLNHPVYDFVVQLESEVLKNSAPVNKHKAYAIQWFIFAGLLIIYYLIASIKRIED